MIDPTVSAGLRPLVFGRASMGAGSSPDLDITVRAGGPVVIPADPVRGIGLGGNLRRADPHDKLRRRPAAPAGRAQADNRQRPERHPRSAAAVHICRQAAKPRSNGQ
jgi:hypothetical protein